MTPTPRDEEETFDPDEIPEVPDESALEGGEALDGLAAEFDAFDDDVDDDDDDDEDVVIELGDPADGRGAATAVSLIAERTDASTNEIASGFVDPDGEGFTDQQPGPVVDPDLDDEAPEDDALDEPFDDEPELVAVPTGDDEVEGLRDGEFVCRGCYIARRETQLADEERQLCRDCA